MASSSISTTTAGAAHPCVHPITADSKRKYSRFSLDLEQSLRMSSDGGMDNTREALGGCCPAALHYDRKVRANAAEIQLVSSFGENNTFLSLPTGVVARFTL